MKERFEVLDIFRGIFSVLVVLFHMEMFTDTVLIKNAFVHHSSIFVDFFFVLSGFVIGYNYQNILDAQMLKGFYLKRFFRLYPLHLVLLLIFVGVEVAKQVLANYVQVNNLNWAGNNTTSFFTSLFLLNSIKFPNVTDVSWNMPSWSISAEMVSYVFFGALFFGISRLKLLRIKNYIYTGIVLLSLLSLYWLTGGFRLTHTFDYGFLRGILGFFTGLLCLSTYTRFKDRIHSFGYLFFNISEVALLASVVFIVSNGAVLIFYGFVYEIVFFACILVFAFERGIVSQALKKSKFLHNLGKYSYSIYMTHILILSLFDVLFIRVLKFSPTAYSYLFIVNLFIIYKVSQWTYTNIEMRFMGVKKVSSKPLAESKVTTVTV